MIKCLNVLTLILAAGLSAQDQLPDLRVQNAGGTVVDIFEVKLLRVEPDGIRVLHAAGTAKVPYELLPEDLQAKYGFNATAAQQHREAATVVSYSAAGPSEPVAAQQPVSQPAFQPSVQFTSALPLRSLAMRASRDTTLSDSNSSYYPTTGRSFNTPAISSNSRYTRSRRSSYGYASNCSPYRSSYYLASSVGYGCYGRAPSLSSLASGSTSSSSTFSSSPSARLGSVSSAVRLGTATTSRRVYSR